MTEEFVTTTVIEWLKKKGWEILAFDFPQSGTGFVMRPNDAKGKTLGNIIPDIVALRKETGLIFENKDRFYYEDFEKLDSLRDYSNYSRSLNILFNGKIPTQLKFGVAIPDIKKDRILALKHAHKIDFLMTVAKGNPSTVKVLKGLGIFNGR